MRSSLTILFLTLILIAAEVVRRRGPADARTRKRLSLGLSVAALALALWSLWSTLADHRRTPAPAPAVDARP